LTTPVPGELVIAGRTNPRCRFTTSRPWRSKIPTSILVPRARLTRNCVRRANGFGRPGVVERESTIGGGGGAVTPSVTSKLNEATRVAVTPESAGSPTTVISSVIGCVPAWSKPSAKL
jgi:hypothetical protein